MLYPIELRVRSWMKANGSVPKVEFGIAARAAPQMWLQWGRAPAGAEFIVAFSPRHIEAVASMGPRPRGRGVVRCPAPTHPRPSRRFNGAAPARARSCLY